MRPTSCRLLAFVLALAPLSFASAKRSPGTDQRTNEKLNEAVEHLNADRFAEAREILGELDFDLLSPYETARVQHLLAAVSQGEGRYGEAREHLRAAIKSGGFNDQEISAAKFQIAQLLLAEERWEEGANALKDWFASGATPNSHAYYLLGVAYYQVKNYAAALEPAQKAIDLAERPQESWLQLLLSLRLERSEYALAAPVLRKLVTAAPYKKEYWMQLANVSAMLENYETALPAMQIPYYAELLTEASEYRRLADLLLHQGVPHRAAVMLRDAIVGKRLTGEAEDWERLGNCWLAARDYDRAVGPLRQAASLSDKGDLYQRLAEVHVQREDWPGAVDALVKAMDKGGLKNLPDVQLLMGIALYHQKKLKDARSWFQRAAQHTKTRSQAKGWVRYIDSEAGG